MPETQPGGSDWSPQEITGLAAAVFGKFPDEIQDVIIIATGPKGQFYQQHVIEGSQHQSMRERACRLIYIQSLLHMAAGFVGGELHEEVHSASD